METLPSILRNQDLGAQELLLEAIDWLMSHPDSLDESHREPTLNLLRNERPAMVGFSVLANRLAKGTHEPESLQVLLQGYKVEIQFSAAKIALKIYPILQRQAPVSILTLSYSSTLREVLFTNCDVIGEVHVLESNPGGEGKRFAEDLRKEQVEVRVHPDRELESLASACDLGLIGADTVFPDGSVLNKVFTRNLAEAMKAEGKPMYVLASQWKFSPELYSLDRLSEHDQKIFERVPSELITEIVSD